MLGIDRRRMSGRRTDRRSVQRPTVSVELSRTLNRTSISGCVRETKSVTVSVHLLGRQQGLQTDSGQVINHHPMHASVKSTCSSRHASTRHPSTCSPAGMVWSVTCHLCSSRRSPPLRRIDRHFHSPQIHETSVIRAAAKRAVSDSEEPEKCAGSLPSSRQDCDARCPLILHREMRTKLFEPGSLDLRAT